jgi:hypothetical protein
MADVSDTTYRTPAKIGYLAQLKKGNGASPETFQAVANLTRITPGSTTTEVIDTTHLRSPARHREKIAGMRDTTSYSIEGFWDPSDESLSNTGGGTGSFTEGGLLGLQVSAEEANWIIEFDVEQFGSPAIEWGPFPAIVTAFTPGVIEANTPLTFTAELTPLRDISTYLP